MSGNLSFISDRSIIYKAGNICHMKPRMRNITSRSLIIARLSESNKTTAQA